MRFFKIVLLAGAWIMLLSTDCLGQYTTPISFWLNPQFTAPTAMSGYEQNQISAHYQKQALTGNIGSRSLILSGQFLLANARNRTQFGTLGVNVMRQESGTSYLFVTNGALLSYNYTVSITNQHHLVGGVQGGYFSRGIDWSKVTTSNQIRDGQFNPDLGHGETFNDEKSSAFTTNLGLAYFLTDAWGEQRFHLGAGMINANKGRFTYLEDDNSQTEPVRWVAYSQLKLISNPSYTLETKLYWQQQNKLQDFVGGLQLNKGINQQRSVADEHLGLGIYYSPDKTATLAMQLMRRNLLLGISYSLPMGNRDLHGIQSGAEVTLGWRLQRQGRGFRHGSSYGGRMPSYNSNKSFLGNFRKRSGSTAKYKVSRQVSKAFKKNERRKASTVRKHSFSQKVSSFKSKAKRNKSVFKKNNSGKSKLSKSYRKARREANRANKMRRWKNFWRSIGLGKGN